MAYNSIGDNCSNGLQIQFNDPQIKLKFIKIKVMTSVNDLSKVHSLVSDLFAWPSSPEQWKEYELSEEQIRFYRENGYLSNIRMLDDRQIKILKEELASLTNVNQKNNSLFYEYHSNESENPATVLFHALGAWRITNGFHDVLWNPRFLL